MTVVFGCTEDSGISVSGTTFTTAESRYNANMSRGAMRSAGTTPYNDLDFDSALTDCWFHAEWASRFADDDGSYLYRFYNDSGTEVFRVDCVSNNNFQAYFWNGSTMTAVGSTWFMADAVTAGVHELVIHIECGASGSFEAFYDGVSVASGSITSASCNNIKKCREADTENSTSYGTYFTENIAADEALVGAGLETQWPISDGTDVDGVGGYGDVDEATRSDTDYVQLANVGDKHSFGIDAFTQTQDGVLAFIVSAVLACDASGPSQARAYIVISGTRYYSSAKTLSLSALPYNFYWQVNPATGLTWTKAQAQSVVEYGIEAYA